MDRIGQWILTQTKIKNSLSHVKRRPSPPLDRWFFRAVTGHFVKSFRGVTGPLAARLLSGEKQDLVSGLESFHAYAIKEAPASPDNCALYQFSCSRNKL
jgi:hypothetical protein